MISLFLGIAMTAIAAAGGITGHVKDSKGKAKSGVTVLIKVGTQKTSVVTDKSGNYVIDVPASQYGSRGKVYVNGTFVVNCLIPSSGAYSRVNITYK